MGGDFLCYVLEMDNGKRPKWYNGKKYIEKNPMLDDEEKGNLLTCLDEVRGAWNGNGNREAVVVQLKHSKILVTGGMSWGDCPTDLFTFIMHLSEADVLSKIGFGR